MTIVDDDTCRVVGVHVRVAFLCACEAIKHFLDDGKTGAIVNVSSVHQIIPKLRFLSYSVSKGGIWNAKIKFEPTADPRLKHRDCWTKTHCLGIVASTFRGVSRFPSHWKTVALIATSEMTMILPRFSRVLVFRMRTAWAPDGRFSS